MEKSQIILLKKMKYKESDLIVWGLDKSGVCSCFLAKGALRSQRRFGSGVLEPTHYMEICYKKAGTGFKKWSVLQEAKILYDFAGLRTSYERIETGLYFVHLVQKVSKEGVLGGQKLFYLLGGALKQAQNSKQLGLLKMHFELKFLYQQGILPQKFYRSEFLDQSLEKHGQVFYQVSHLDALKSDIARCVHNYINS